ncbi:MAG: anti-sigma factor [Actinobacteria bacterium]|nr:anti-sigma factor [Actinomycetota bacterium]
MTSPDIHTLTGAYAVDALEEDERQLFELHIRECDACAQEIAEFHATAAAVGDAAHEPPPPSMKAAVLAEIDTVRQERPLPSTVTDLASRRDPWYQRLLAPAAAVLAIAVLGMTAIIANMNGRIATMETQTARVADVVAAADASIIEMPGFEGANARLVYSASRGEGIFLADGLPEAPGEKVYELWFIGEDGASPAGLFDADERGRVTHVLTGDLSQVQAIGVTVEPAGGSAQPTSDPIMVAEV